ncbi:uncharacterized protein LOC143023863 [Oratosquilla oratoria]|uniref:uncharacterized protein LOC143023863 n=1 Tax=Oratosquilla oratoria TaxID=337810 RepID=UPI003F76AC6A
MEGCEKSSNFPFSTLNSSFFTLHNFTLHIYIAHNSSWNWSCLFKSVRGRSNLTTPPYLAFCRKFKALCSWFEVEDMVPMSGRGLRLVSLLMVLVVWMNMVFGQTEGNTAATKSNSWWTKRALLPSQEVLQETLSSSEDFQLAESLDIIAPEFCDRLYYSIPTEIGDFGTTLSPASSSCVCSEAPKEGTF